MSHEQGDEIDIWCLEDSRVDFIRTRVVQQMNRSWGTGDSVMRVYGPLVLNRVGVMVSAAALVLVGGLATGPAYGATLSAGSTTVARCSPHQLSAKVVGGLAGAAGTDYGDLSITNTSTTSCFLQGHPSARFSANKTVTGAGSSYLPDGSKQSRVLLRAKGHAYLRLGIVNSAGWPSGCRPVRADAVRLRLPRTSATLSVPFGHWRVEVCKNPKDKQLEVSQFLRGRTTRT